MYLITTDYYPAYHQIQHMILCTFRIAHIFSTETSSFSKPLYWSGDLVMIQIHFILSDKRFNSKLMNSKYVFSQKEALTINVLLFSFLLQSSLQVTLQDDLFYFLQN